MPPSRTEREEAGRSIRDDKRTSRHAGERSKLRAAIKQGLCTYHPGFHVVQIDESC